MKTKLTPFLLVFLFLPALSDAQILCVDSSVKVKNGVVPVGAALTIRNKCKSGEKAIFNTATLRGPKGDARATSARDALPEGLLSP